MSRRKVTPFSLSFLDIMFCGFGAVVLLVLILNHETVKSREEVFTDLRAEAVACVSEGEAGVRGRADRVRAGLFNRAGDGVLQVAVRTDCAGEGRQVIPGVRRRTTDSLQTDK